MASPVGRGFPAQSGAERPFHSGVSPYATYSQDKQNKSKILPFEVCRAASGHRTPGAAGASEAAFPEALCAHGSLPGLNTPLTQRHKSHLMILGHLSVVSLFQWVMLSGINNDRLSRLLHLDLIRNSY